MMKYLGKILHILVIGFIGILACFCLIFAGMQTRGFKKFAERWLLETCQKAGFILTAKEIDGILPFQWVFTDLHFEIDPRNTIDVKKARLRLAVFPLLKKELAISYLSLSDTALLFSEDTTAIPPMDFPWTISLRSLRAEKISVKKFETQEMGSFSLRGKAMLQKHLSGFLTDLKLSADLFPNSSFEFYSKLKKGHLEIAAQLQSQSAKAFSPFMTIPYHAQGTLGTRLSGPLITWKALFSDSQPPASTPLTGDVEGWIDRIDIPHFKIANRKWSLTSQFELFADHRFLLKTCNLKSNIFKLTSNARFGPHYAFEEGEATFDFPKLALVSLYLPITLNGTLHGNIHITNTTGFFEMQGEGFTIASQEYPVFRALFKADKEQDGWRGKAELLADNKLMPVTGQADFTLNDAHLLNLKNIRLNAPETTFAGGIAIDIPKKEVNGSCFGQILSLRPYRAWTTHHSSLAGSAGLNLTFLGNIFKGGLILKNLQYYNTLADELSLDVTLAHPFSTPEWQLVIEGEKLYTPPFYLSRYGLYTDWDGKQGPYRLFAKGEWKKPFEINSTGSLSDHGLNINTLYGNLLQEEFSLEHPFSLTAADDTLKLSPCDLQFGKGHLSTALHLNKAFSSGYLKAQNFPLDLLLVSYPNLSLEGNTHVEAHLEGNEDSLSGKLDLTLEALDIYQSDHTSPLHAKGTVHAELCDRTLAWTSDIVASEGQFFKSTASIPIEYNLYPCKVWLNTRRPVAGTLDLNGKIEEIFDFMNIGSHRITGQISSQLALSQNFTHPSLSGHIDIQEGSYENYYSGTHLKNISAHLEAEGKKMTLSQFQANDEQNGLATATGELEIDPIRRFPYTALAQLTDIQLLKFDSVQGQLTGPLNITGTTHSALAEGNLTVTKADLNIPDTLPPDIPVIPVTFVNKPPHLDAYTIQSLPLFPFNLKLDLTAPGPINLRGKGLRSEWQGNALLSGTNANITARGNLTLMKGEFVFSGKVFTLSQGEIVFSDQNSQHAFINLKGELALPDLTVTVILSGPLKAPLLTFQSSPHLPTSSILSYILFNKDISDITAFQALQVAQTILTLSGGAGPDVLEKIRKSIGVDRLNIISSSQNPDEMALQIGKYLTKGVMVTLAQGFNSSQIIVEVELKYGFLLQAETQEVEEGKFSLKWNRNY